MSKEKDMISHLKIINGWAWFALENPDKEILTPGMINSMAEWTNEIAEWMETVSNAYSSAALTPFDVLERISTSYWGKQMYFLEDCGTVYDRYKGECITLEEAVRRFERMVADDG